MTLPALALHAARERLDQAAASWAAEPLAALAALADADANLSMLLAVAAQDAFAAGHPLAAIQHAAHPATNHTTTTAPLAPAPAGNLDRVPVEACVALCEAEGALSAVAAVWERRGPVAALDVLLAVVDHVEAAAGHAITAAAQLPTS